MRFLPLAVVAIAVPFVLTLVAMGGGESQVGGNVRPINTTSEPSSVDEVSEPRVGSCDNAGATIRYTIQPGDTASEIARLFAVPLEELLAENALLDPNRVIAGARIAVPVRPSPPPRQSAGMGSIEQLLRQAECDHRLPSGLLLALAWQESGWRQDTVSSAGAVGVTQVLPSTANWAQQVLLDEELDWHGDAEDNARVGAAYLRYLLDRADDDVWQALAAYHQGWRGVDVDGPSEETRSYVRNVFALVPRFQPPAE